MRTPTDDLSGQRHGARFVFDLALVALAATCSTPPAVGDLFGDTEFELANWELTAQSFGVGGTVSFSQEPAGGNPAANLRIGMDFHDTPPGAVSGIATLSFDRNAQFVPAAHPGMRIDFSLDYSWDLPSPTPNPVPELYLIFYTRCTTDYFSHLHWTSLAPTDGGWQTVQGVHLMSAPYWDFPTTFDGGLWGIAPLEFGFALSHGLTSDGSDLLSEVRIDNWRVSVSVPEPASALMLAAVSVVAARRRRIPTGY